MTTSAIETRYRQRAAALAKLAKWPAIGALIAGGALLVSRLIGPSVAEQLGARAGEGFARGVIAAQEQVAALRRQLSIGGWGETASLERRVLRGRLQQMPGLVSQGVVIQNPEAPRARQVCAYEVRWLRGQTLPNLPATLEGYPVKLVVVDAYPVAQRGRGR